MVAVGEGVREWPADVVLGQDGRGSLGEDDEVAGGGRRYGGGGGMFPRQAYPAWGYRLITAKLPWEGLRVNSSRVYRLYRESDLVMKRGRKPLHRSSVRRSQFPSAQRASETWPVGFMVDEAYDGRRFRILTVVDDLTRECLAAEAGQRMTGRLVKATLAQVGLRRGALPGRLRVVNGSEFTIKARDRWAYGAGVKLGLSRWGKPPDNGIIEPFHSQLRNECLNTT